MPSFEQSRRRDLPAGLLELEHRGLARTVVPNDPSLYPELPPLAPDGTAAELIDWTRGER